MPNVPYSYEVNWQLVPGNGSLSNSSLTPSLTLHTRFWNIREEIIQELSNKEPIRGNTVT